MSIQNYIQAKDKAGFEEALGKGKVTENQIAFIESDDLIWARGKYYGAIPDNEDLTKDKFGKLQFSNRSYSPADFSGKGYKILRKNMVAGKNVLTQEMITDSNTIYEVRYDYDLEGAEITIPKGCTLKFEGGSLNNGSIVGNDTDIKASKLLIFKQISIKGEWCVEDIYQIWFDFINNDIDSSNNFNNFNNLISLTNKNVINNIYFNGGIYRVTLPDRTNLMHLKSNTNLYLGTCTIKLNKSRYNHRSLIVIKNASNVNIYNGILIGDARTHEYDLDTTTAEHCAGIKINDNSKNISITGTVCSEMTGDGIEIVDNATNQISDVHIESVICNRNNRQGLSIEAGVNITVLNSQFINTSTIHNTAPGSGIDIEPWKENTIIRNVLIEGCDILDNIGDPILIQPNIKEVEKKEIINNIVVKDCNIKGDLFISECNTVKLINIDNTLPSIITNDRFLVAKNLEFINCKFNNIEVNAKSENFKFSNCELNRVILVHQAVGMVFDGCIIKERIEFVSINSELVNCHCRKVNSSLNNNIIKNCEIEDYQEYYPSLKDPSVQINNVLTNNIIYSTNKSLYSFGNEIVNNIFFIISNLILNGSNVKVGSNKIINVSDSLINKEAITCYCSEGKFILIDNLVYNYLYLVNYHTGSEKININSNQYIQISKDNYINITYQQGCNNIINNVNVKYDVTSSTWVDSDGNPVDSIKQGTTEQRPTGVKAGFYYFDTTLGKPIWKKDDTTDTWVDGSGAEV